MFGFRKDLDRIVAGLEAVQTALVQVDRAQPAESALTDLTEQVTQVTAEVEDLQHQFKDVLQAVAEGIERTERAERRVQQTVKRARKELKDRDLEDPGLEAEAEQLRIGDGGRSPDIGLQPMPTGVGPAAEAASSIKGVSVAALHRVRGY